MKKLLYLLGVLFSLQASAQIGLGGYISTLPGGRYPTHLAELGKGGLISVNGIAGRNAIEPLRRESGMIAIDTSVTPHVWYQLVGGILNSNWQEVIFSGGAVSLPAGQVGVGTGTGISGTNNFTWDNHVLKITNTLSGSYASLQAASGNATSEASIALFNDVSGGYAALEFFGSGMDASLANKALFTANATSLGFATIGASPIVFYTNYQGGGPEKLRIAPDGELLINRTTTVGGSFKLQNQGDFYNAGTITAPGITQNTSTSLKNLVIDDATGQIYKQDLPTGGGATDTTSLSHRIDVLYSAISDSLNEAVTVFDDHYFNGLATTASPLQPKIDAVPINASDLPVQSGGVYNSLLLKAPLASPNLTGAPTAPTPATTDSTNKLATTAFVKQITANISTTGSSTATDTLNAVYVRDSTGFVWKWTQSSNGWINVRKLAGSGSGGSTGAFFETTSSNITLGTDSYTVTTSPGGTAETIQKFTGDGYFKFKFVQPDATTPVSASVIDDVGNEWRIVRTVSSGTATLTFNYNGTNVGVSTSNATETDINNTYKLYRSGGAILLFYGPSDTYINYFAANNSDFTKALYGSSTATGAGNGISGAALSGATLINR